MKKGKINRVKQNVKIKERLLTVSLLVMPGFIS